MNRCRDGGYLVDGRNTLPGDPSDFHTGGVPVVGCTRLRCSRCGAEVRDVPGISFREEVKPDLKALYDAPDLTSAAEVERQPARRQYLCRCSQYGATIYHALEPEDSDTRAANVPWECQGHPLVTLPHDFDGVLVNDAAGLTALVAAVLRGEVPAKARPQDRDPARYAYRLHHRVTGTPLTATIEAALRSAAPGDPRAQQVLDWL